MKHEFQRVEERWLRLWDCGWLIATRYAVTPAGGPGMTKIASLLVHRVYRRSFTGSDRDTETTHGPFVIARMSPVDFIEIPFLAIREGIHERFDNVEFSDEPPAAEQIAAVDAFLDSLSGRAATCFRLGLDRKDEARGHVASSILWIFDEYIVIENDGSLWILVVGFD